MCRICVNAMKLPVKEALEEIGKAMKAKGNSKHFEQTLDVLLGTAIPNTDPELDEVWERSKGTNET